MFSLKPHITLEPTLQIAHTECGLACARTILAAHGRHLSITDLRQVREPGRDGLSTQELKLLLAQQGMEAAVYKVKDPKALEALAYPIIVFWKGNHFICVESLNDHHATVMDPSIGRTRITRAEFDEGFDTYVIAAAPGEHFERRASSSVSKWRRPYLWPEGTVGLYAGMLVSSLLLVATTIGIPIATQHLVDRTAKGTISFPQAMAALAVATLITVALMYARTVIAVRMMCAFSWHLSRGAFQKLLSLPARYFTVRAPGETIYRLNALGQLPNLLGVTIIQGLLESVSAVAVLAYVFWISPVLGSIIVVALAGMLAFLSVTQPVVNRATDAEIHEGSNAQSVQLDAIVSVNSVKLGGYMSTYLKDWEKAFRRLLDVMAGRMRLQQGVIGSALSVMQMFGPLMLLVVSLEMTRNGSVSLGEAIAVQAVSALLFSYVRSVFSTWTEFQTAGRYLELAEDVFAYPSEPTHDSDAELTQGAIECHDLGFRYSEGAPLAVAGVSLTVAPGETLALVGMSGSGKTTLGKILGSLFEPTQGRLAFDGREVCDYDVEHLRRGISYIPQEAYLHNRTILENLHLGCDKSDEEIIEFCRGLGFLDFIDEFPMGYHTGITELGANLSGGQRQRIHVARVLLQNPTLLIMDEATASLDNITQEQVYQRLSALKCTKIIIAHRFATILNADRVAVMENGRIVQLGSHQQLMEAEGMYSDLFHAELLGAPCHA